MPIIDKDFVKLYRKVDGKWKRQAETLVWGDAVELLDDWNPDDNYRPVRCPELYDGKGVWFVRGNVPVRDANEPGILRMSMVDVQQGDGMILETPDTREIVLIDGGDNKLFARHFAARFLHRGATVDDRLPVAAVIITHGDGDHFDGLNELRRSEDLPNHSARKRCYIRPARVLHNGLVKRRSNRPDAELLGPTTEEGGDLYCVGLVDDPREVPQPEQNQYFRYWSDSLDHWEEGGAHPIEVRRVHADLDPTQVFDFLGDSLKVDLLGPTQTTLSDDHNSVPALKFFKAPKKSAVLHLEHGDGAGSPSASHTINGHSIAFRLTYGNVRMMFTGDLNHEAMEGLLNADDALLETDILKAPHHGSADFSLEALRRMKPVVALVSSGDESSMKEYIHPRATLMAGLGQSMPADTPGVVFCTELAAFFTYRKTASTRADLVEFFEKYDLSDEEAQGGNERQFSRSELLELLQRNSGERPTTFEAFERTNFGIIHIRTNGSRVLVFSHSGRAGLNEAYSFTVSRDPQTGDRVVTFDQDVSTQ